MSLPAITLCVPNLSSPIVSFDETEADKEAPPSSPELTLVLAENDTLRLPIYNAEGAPFSEMFEQLYKVDRGQTTLHWNDLELLRRLTLTRHQVRAFFEAYYKGSCPAQPQRLFPAADTPLYLSDLSFLARYLLIPIPLFVQAIAKLDATALDKTAYVLRRRHWFVTRFEEIDTFYESRLKPYFDKRGFLDVCRAIKRRPPFESCRKLMDCIRNIFVAYLKDQGGTLKDQDAISRKWPQGAGFTRFVYAYWEWGTLRPSAATIKCHIIDADAEQYLAEAYLTQRGLLEEPSHAVEAPDLPTQPEERSEVIWKQLKKQLERQSKQIKEICREHALIRPMASHLERLFTRCLKVLSEAPWQSDKLNPMIHDHLTPPFDSILKERGAPYLLTLFEKAAPAPHVHERLLIELSKITRSYFLALPYGTGDKSDMIACLVAMAPQLDTHTASLPLWREFTNSLTCALSRNALPITTEQVEQLLALYVMTATSRQGHPELRSRAVLFFGMDDLP